jgi:predicted O-methyltransferase YrrM
VREIRLQERESGERLTEYREGLRAMLRRWRWSRNPPWPGFGQPLNGQECRRRTIDLLIASFEPETLVETGTFMGFTTRYLTAKKIDTYTVEVAPGYGWMASRSLGEIENLTLVHGDSGAAVESLGSRGLLRRPFAYLDAHWEERLPLHDEVTALNAHCPDYLVAIDDFKVPQMPEYGYDTYNGVAIAIEAIPIGAGAAEGLLAIQSPPG